MTYQVLARSWRPQRFADLLGQEAAVQTLSNALRAGTFGQAYVFSGLRGVGKTTVARLLAKAVNCVEGPTPEPCGRCVSCQEITEGSSIDVIEIDAATHTQVEKVRDLQELLRYRPTRDRYRVIIFDEVHMLSPSAFNALLKTIEEPPPYILWVMATTERSKVPATILSGCQQLEFRPVAQELVRARLEEIASKEGFSLTPSAAAAIAGAAAGSVRDALSLLDQLRAFAADEVDDEAVATVLGVPPLEIVARLIEVLAAGDTQTGLRILREQLEAGQDPSILYQEIGRTLRTLLYLAIDPELAPTLSEGQKELLKPLVDGLGADPLTRMLGLWLENEFLIKDTGIRELGLEVAAVRLARWPAVQRIEEWLTGSGNLPGPGGPGSSSSVSGSSPGRGGGEPSSGRSAAAPETPSSPPPAAAPTEDAGGPPEAPPVVENELEETVKADPGVVLAMKILGGDIVSVRPDGEGS